eukprot:superscaffoldBa00004987_g19747
MLGYARPCQRVRAQYPLLPSLLKSPILLHNIELHTTALAAIVRVRNEKTVPRKSDRNVCRNFPARFPPLQ